MDHMPDMPDMPSEHAGDHHAHAGDGTTMPGEQRGTDLPPGDGPAPAVRPGRPADRYYDPQAMAAAEAALLAGHGGMVFHRFLADVAEYRAGAGGDGYRWHGEFWIGGDLNRLVLKSEGEGSFAHGVENAEIQALYARALDPYWNLQAGLRHDFAPSPRRTYAVLGVEGLAPYWIETEAALFLSDKGLLRARLTGSYDQRITSRLILQPRLEANFAFQDMRRERIGAGLSSLELGLRLRYEIAREFAPYVGLSWERKLGATADLARAAGEDTGGPSFVAGLRAWF
jgi:copper resistance protein B